MKNISSLDELIQEHKMTYGEDAMSECTTPAVAEEITEDDARNMMGYTPPEDNNAAYYYSEGWNACLDEIASAPTPEQQDHPEQALELVAALECCVAVFDLFGSSGGPASTKARAALSAYREKQS